jgi:pSer/pThr/pTyr-binding forkhead associated (FHA) protein
MLNLCQNPLASPIAKQEAEKRMMDVTLQVQLGTWFGKKVRVPVGHPVVVGRGPRSDISLSNDPYVSRVHFSLDWDDTACWVSDLNSHHGTFLNDKRVQKARLRDGDKIRVGWTVLVVRLEVHDSATGRETAANETSSGYL